MVLSFKRLNCNQFHIEIYLSNICDITKHKSHSNAFLYIFVVRTSPQKNGLYTAKHVNYYIIILSNMMAFCDIGFGLQKWTKLMKCHTNVNDLYFTYLWWSKCHCTRLLIELLPRSLSIAADAGPLKRNYLKSCVLYLFRSVPLPYIEGSCRGRW